MDEGIQLKTNGPARARRLTSGILSLVTISLLSTTLVGYLSAQTEAAAQNPTPSQSQTDDFDTVRANATAARTQGNTAQALQLYSRAVELNPAWAEGWFYLGALHYGADEYAAARDALSKAIALTPDATAALALRGLCEFETGQYPESLQDIEHGIALGAANEPRNAEILIYHQALLLTRLGRFDEAIEKYVAFVKHAPGNPELEIAVGLAGLRMPLLPRDVEASQIELLSMVGHAAIAVMKGDHAAGEAAFQKVFERYPTAPNVHYMYGCLLFTGHYDEAISQLAQEVAVTPNSATAHAMLAWVKEYDEDFEGALPDAEKAATEDPSLPLGQLVYARALVGTGDVTNGLTHIQQVLLAEPNNLEAHMTLAMAYSKLGRSEESLQERMLCLQLAQTGAAGAGADANP